MRKVLFLCVILASVHLHAAASLDTTKMRRVQDINLQISGLQNQIQKLQEDLQQKQRDKDPNYYIVDIR